MPFAGNTFISTIFMASPLGIISLFSTSITKSSPKLPLTASSTAVKTVSMGAVINMVTVVLSHSPLGLQMV